MLFKWTDNLGKRSCWRQAFGSSPLSPLAYPGPVLSCSEGITEEIRYLTFYRVTPFGIRAIDMGPELTF